MKNYNKPVTEVCEWLGSHAILTISGPFKGVDENSGSTKPVSSARAPKW